MRTRDNRTLVNWLRYMRIYGPIMYYGMQRGFWFSRPTQRGHAARNPMPKLEQKTLVWPDGTRIDFATVEAALDALNQITWALDMNSVILEAY